MAAPMVRRFRGLSAALNGLRSRVGAAGAGLWPRWAPRLSVACYNARRLGLDLSGFHLPDRESAETPEWQRGPRAERKLYGRYGAASGIPAASLWPSPEQLQEMVRHQSEWEPSLQQMRSSLQAQELELQKKQQARQKLIAANMAKMPRMVADWRREKRELKMKQREEKARRELLLSEARERFGYSIDPRNAKFQEMVKELEKEEKKKRKLMKRRQKETVRSEAAAAVGSEAATVTSP
ncbi:large ribosomal subunit protein mL64 [Heptranchias perlo]|uniref:large ribosomal subunit protein mL64 n=1 Tax=Heptranchias perlo TaxID=212740 RepID=UPI00355AC2CD